MERITCAQARAHRLLKYYTGKPCKHGHVCERYTSNHHCVDCAVKNRRSREETRIACKKWRESHREHIRKYMRDYMAMYWRRQKAARKLKLTASAADVVEGSDG